MFREENNSQNLRGKEKIAAWAPLRHSKFRALWIATLISNTGTWMQTTATAWLMTLLDPSTVMVSLVQTAISLPAFLLALPAGALADVFDRRRMILFTQAWMLTAAAALGFLTIADLTTPWMLLTLTLLLGLGSALNGPAWQAIVPELAPRTEIAAAVALNSASFNVARSIGPALGGLLIVATGPGVVFLLNAASYLAVMLVLFFWRRIPEQSDLPPERIAGAMKKGVRYVRYEPFLRAILVRATSFMTGGIVLIAVLPLFARNELGVDSVGYGILLGTFGVGAVAGAAVLPEVRRRMEIDALIVASTLLFAAVLIGLAVFHHFIFACALLVLGGAIWLALIATFNSTIQTMVPSWVRGRVMAVYILTIFGSMAFGSLLWGSIAAFVGIPATFAIAALSMIAGLAPIARFRLPAMEEQDHTPSNHWPAPTLAAKADNGPVLVSIEYRIEPDRWSEFRTALLKLRDIRFRGGAIRWNLYVDAADPTRYVESFLVESWIDHLRQHQRVTVSDREIERNVHSFHTGSTRPRVTHFFVKSLKES